MRFVSWSIFVTLTAPRLVAFYSFTILAPFSQLKSVLFITISEQLFVVSGWKHISSIDDPLRTLSDIIYFSGMLLTTDTGRR